MAEFPDTALLLSDMGWHIFLLSLLVIACGETVRAADATFQSGPGRTSLLELYTSEGCSSCPPAEAWLSGLRHSPRLWKDVVPISFHVDYWDNLGWKDALASPAFTQRQRSYVAAWGGDTVYTPEFVLNGHEWRTRTLDAVPAPGGDAGRLSATIASNGAVRISFDAKSRMGLQVHVALLGLDLSSDVVSGENGGRHLVHDFVVLSLQTSDLVGGPPGAVVQLPADKIVPGQSALAVWITQAGSLDPLQATGGML